MKDASQARPCSPQPDASAACPASARFVIHTAGVVPGVFPKLSGYREVIEPAVKGVRNVLGSVNRTASVEKGGWIGGVGGVGLMRTHTCARLPATTWQGVIGSGMRSGPTHRNLLPTLPTTQLC